MKYKALILSLYIVMPLSMVVWRTKLPPVAHGQGFASLVSVSSETKKLATHTMPLNDRYAEKSVNSVFRDNILLNLYYMSGKVKNAGDINWNEIHKPMHSEFTLRPGEIFAFHEDVLGEYQSKKVISTNAHFNAQEGFVSDGYLYGDGVCHLASLINWAARDAGLSVKSPTSHSFANIPDVPSEYGVAIYSNPGSSDISKMQNLYIENNFDKNVRIVFDYANDNLTVSFYKDL